QRQRTNPASVSRVDLFSHPAPPEMVEQHRQPADAGDGVDWQAAPFSGGAAGSAEPRRTVVDVRDAPQVPPAPPQGDPGRCAWPYRAVVVELRLPRGSPQP